MMGNMQWYIIERSNRAYAEGTPAALQVQYLRACTAAALAPRMTVHIRTELLCVFCLSCFVWSADGIRLQTCICGKHLEN